MSTSSNQASRPPGFAVTHECSVPTLLHPSHKEFDSPRHMCDRRYCLVSPHGVAPSLPYLAARHESATPLHNIWLTVCLLEVCFVPPFAL